MSSTLADRLLAARKAKGLSQVRLAKLAGLSQPSLSNIESGETTSLRGATLIRLAEALQVDPHWLQGGADANLPERPPFHEEEQALKLLRKLSPEDRERWLAIGRVLLECSSVRAKNRGALAAGSSTGSGSAA
jgi:transcriptional regulator with XRE-family HTH domain